jgi:hypothetical protein
VVAFTTSTLLGLLGCLAVWLYGKRRPVGALFFWFYGVIPHYWLAWADNELNWRSDVYLAQSGQALFGQEWLSWWPLDIPMLVVRDIIVTNIYIVGLVIHVALWMLWQNRGKERPATVPASRYGRPLVRKG